MPTNIVKNLKYTINDLKQLHDLPIGITLSMIYAFAYLLLLFSSAIEAWSEISLTALFVGTINVHLIFAVTSRKAWAYRLLKIGLGTAMTVVSWITLLYSQTYINTEGSFTVFLTLLAWANIHLFLTIVFFTHTVRAWFGSESLSRNKSPTYPVP